VPLPPYPSVPAPRTWSAGPILASALRADVYNAVLFLANRPLYFGQTNFGTSIANASDLTFGLNIDLIDTWDGHASTTSSAYNCQAPGWYLCDATVPFAYTTATQAVFAAGFSGLTGGVAFGPLRGQLQLMGSGRNPSPQVCDLIEQTVAGPPGGSGDFIELIGFQATGSPVSLSATATKLPYMKLRWVAATSGTVSLPVPASPAWPVPPSYITSSFLNTNIRDTVRFLTYPPIYRAHYVAGSATLPNQAFPAGTVIALTNIDVDNYGGGTTGATAGYTAPVAGTYFCYGQFNLASNTNTTAYCAGLAVNGGTTQWGDSVYKLTDTTGGGAAVRKRLRLSAGDKVQLIGCQGSGGAIGYNSTAINQTRMIVVWDGS
jgi:hypothetical protein